jgi:chloride channel protein, CIC family
MAAILGGTMRAPLTGIVFTLELTHDIDLLLPLLVATAIAHGFTVLVMRRSILTEKVSRRGFHLSREYAVDPMEVLFVREVMRVEVVALPADLPLDDLTGPIRLHGDRPGLSQGLYPVVDEDQKLIGVITRTDLHRLTSTAADNGHIKRLNEIVKSEPIVAYPDEPLRIVIERMATTGLTRFPVIDRADPTRLVGMISLSDFLRARQRNLEDERTRERVLTLRFPINRRGRQSPTSANGLKAAGADRRGK